MKTVLRKVVKTFKRLGDALLLAFGRKVSAAMAKEVKTFANPVPALADINAELDKFQSLMKLAGSRDVKTVAEKNASRKVLISLLSNLADYINYTAKNDVVALASTLYPLNKIPEPIKLKAATRLTLKDGDNRGELLLKFRRPRGATGFVCQYSTDPLLAEKSWVSFQGTTATYVYKGLTKGTTYYCRVISLCTGQQEVESMVVNRTSQ